MSHPDAPTDAGSDVSASDVSIDEGGDSAAPDASSDGGGDAPTADSASDGGADAPPPDAPDETDAAPVTCDLLTQAPCATGERCTLVVDYANSIKEPRCVADGTLDEHALCTRAGTSTLTDDCIHGLICTGWCTQVCNLASPSCGPNFGCVQMSGLFPDDLTGAVGVCVPTCNPLTQKVDYDGAPACNSDPLNPTSGCYLAPGAVASCMQAGDAANTSDVPPDSSNTIYVNSCAPGYAPLLVQSSKSSKQICVAYCEPGPTDNTNPANAAGLVGSGYTCPDKGAGGTHECRYWSYLEREAGATKTSAWSDTLGFCFDYTKYEYDSNGDSVRDTQFPSCTTITPGLDNDADGVVDTVQWGCTP